MSWQRVYVWRVVFLALLGYDSWSQVYHAARYGILDFNVSHFPVLDRFVPGWAYADLTLFLLWSSQCYLAIRLVMEPHARLPMVFLMLSYGWSFFVSQLDSWQHHYLVWLILLILCFLEPRQPRSKRKKSKANELERNWPMRLLLVELAVVYLWAVLPKIEPEWVKGNVLQAFTGRAPGIRYLASFLPGDSFFMFASWGAPATEAFLAYTIFTGKHKWLAVLAGVGLHMGIEVAQLKIGIFSYYMIASYFLVMPKWFVAKVIKLIPPVVYWYNGSLYSDEELEFDDEDQDGQAKEAKAAKEKEEADGAGHGEVPVAKVVAKARKAARQKGRKGGRSTQSTGNGTMSFKEGTTAVELLTYVSFLFAGPALIFLLLPVNRNVHVALMCLAFGIVVELPLSIRARRLRGVTHFVACLGVLFLCFNTVAVTDYYRYLGGDNYRRGHHELAYEAYQNSYRLAPNNPKLAARCGDMAHRLNRPEEAVRYLMEAEQLGMGSEDVLAMITMNALKSNQQATMETYAKKSRQLNYVVPGAVEEALGWEVTPDVWRSKDTKKKKRKRRAKG